MYLSSTPALRASASNFINMAIVLGFGDAEILVARFDTEAQGYFVGSDIDLGRSRHGNEPGAGERILREGC